MSLIGIVASLYLGYRGVERLFVDETIKSKIADIHKGNLAVSAAAKLKIKELNSLDREPFWGAYDTIIVHASAIDQVLDVALEKNASREVLTLIAVYKSVFKEMVLGNRFLDIASNSKKQYIAGVNYQIINELFENFLYLLVEFSANQMITFRSSKLVPIFQVKKTFRKLISQSQTKHLPGLANDAYRSIDITLRLLVFSIIEENAPRYFCSNHKSFFKYDQCNELFLIYMLKYKIYLPLVLEYRKPFLSHKSNTCKVYLIRYQVDVSNSVIELYYSDLDTNVRCMIQAEDLNGCKDLFLSRHTKIFAGAEIFYEHEQRIYKFSISKSKLESQFFLLRTQLEKKLKSLKKNDQSCLKNIT